MGRPPDIIPPGQVGKDKAGKGPIITDREINQLRGKLHFAYTAEQNLAGLLDMDAPISKRIADARAETFDAALALLLAERMRDYAAELVDIAGRLERKAAGEDLTLLAGADPTS